MSWQIYLSLSAMMYFDYAVRGSWGPVLSAHLLGPMKMSGKQAGWIYSMYPLACVVSPLIGGQIVDRWIATEWFLGAANLVGGVALLAASRANTFPSMLALVGLHCLFFAPTLGLVNSLAFTHMTDPKLEYFRVRVWSSVAWVSVGWLLSAWRYYGKTPFRGSDALLLGSLFSFVMAVYAPLCLPHTPPPGSSHWAASWPPLVAMLSSWKVIVFLVLSLIVSSQLQFYFIGTSKFLEDIGFPRANVPAIMTVAQMATVGAMVFVLPYLFPRIGYQGTLSLGAFFWLALYLIYVLQPPRWLIVAAQALHGLAYAFFFDAAFIYVNQIAPAEIRGTAQSLYTVITVGLGLFLGTHFAGIVLDRCRHEGRIHWRPFFATPCLTLVVCIAAFLLFFAEQ
jgi:MFS family permease